MEAAALFVLSSFSLRSLFVRPWPKSIESILSTRGEHQWDSEKNNLFGIVMWKRWCVFFCNLTKPPVYDSKSKTNLNKHQRSSLSSTDHRFSVFCVCVQFKFNFKFRDAPQHTPNTRLTKKWTLNITMSCNVMSIKKVAHRRQHQLRTLKELELQRGSIRPLRVWEEFEF